MESIPDNRIRRPRTEPSRPGWLGLLFGETDSRRLTVAFSFAIAIVAIFAPIFVALMAARTVPADDTVANVEVVQVSKKPKPTPSPTPRPKPTIRPLIIAQVVDPGKSARKEIVKKPAANRPKVVIKYHSKPIIAVPVLGGQGAGAGRKGTVGSLGTGGSGSGAGDQGNGSGGVCGAVDFSDPSAASLDAASGLWIYDGIQMSVHYADGHAETVTLDYSWHYRNPAMDPFKNSGAPMLFQFPPKSMRGTEPALVQYVMAHTDVMGTTELNECGNISSPPPSRRDERHVRQR